MGPVKSGVTGLESGAVPSLRPYRKATALSTGPTRARPDPVRNEKFAETL